MAAVDVPRLPGASMPVALTSELSAPATLGVPGRRCSWNNYLTEKLVVGWLPSHQSCCFAKGWVLFVCMFVFC